MARREPQLEEIRVPPAPAPREPATAPPVAVPTGMRDVLALSSPLQRRRFVLQLQRSAGNAAVCRWLAGAPEEPPEAPRSR